MCGQSLKTESYEQGRIQNNYVATFGIKVH